MTQQIPNFDALYREVFPIPNLLEKGKYHECLSKVTKVIHTFALSYLSLNSAIRNREQGSKIRLALIQFQMVAADIHIHAGDTAAAICCYVDGAMIDPELNFCKTRLAILLSALHESGAADWGNTLARPQSAGNYSDFPWVTKLAASAVHANSGRIKLAIDEFPTEFDGIAKPLEYKTRKLFSDLQEGRPICWGASELRRWSMIDFMTSWKLVQAEPWDQRLS